MLLLLLPAEITKSQTDARGERSGTAVSQLWYGQAVVFVWQQAAHTVL